MRGAGMTSWWARGSKGSGPGAGTPPSGSRGTPPARRRRHAHLVRLVVLAMIAAVLPLTGAVLAQPAQAATTCPTGGCTVHVSGFDFTSGAPLTDFTYIVNVDNSKRSSDPLSLSTESNSPVVAEGDASRTTLHLDAGRYLISMRSHDHKMWGSTSPC